MLDVNVEVICYTKPSITKERPTVTSKKGLRRVSELSQAWYYSSKLILSMDSSSSSVKSLLAGGGIRSSKRSSCAIR